MNIKLYKFDFRINLNTPRRRDGAQCRQNDNDMLQ